MRIVIEHKITFTQPQLMERLMTGLTDLTTNVAQNTSAVQSAVTLLGNLKTQLDAAIAASQGGDDSQLEALSQTLGNDDQALAAAVVANTPAAKS
jgi:hypothetical protein